MKEARGGARGADPPPAGTDLPSPRNYLSFGSQASPARPPSHEDAFFENDEDDYDEEMDANLPFNNNSKRGSIILGGSSRGLNNNPNNNNNNPNISPRGMVSPRGSVPMQMASQTISTRLPTHHATASQSGRQEIRKSVPPLKKMNTKYAIGDYAVSVTSSSTVPTRRV